MELWRRASAEHSASRRDEVTSMQPQPHAAGSMGPVAGSPADRASTETADSVVTRQPVHEVSRPRTAEHRASGETASAATPAAALTAHRAASTVNRVASRLGRHTAVVSAATLAAFPAVERPAVERRLRDRSARRVVAADSAAAVVMPSPVAAVTRSQEVVVMPPAAVDTQVAAADTIVNT